MELSVSFTRRTLTIGISALGLGGAVAGLSRLGVKIVKPAQAAEPTVAELMKPPIEDMVLGDEHAPVTLIEYASATCPHCAHFSVATFPELKKRYVDTGKVRFIFREFPLDRLAAAGFMLARCAGKDKYFPLIETLFAQQRDWAVQKPLEPMLQIAKLAGFTKESFDACLSNQQVLDGIEKMRDQAAKDFAVNSTPTFFLNGKRISGDISLEELEKEMAPYLKA
jgi:protein-disulfide isomerase